MLLKGVMIRTGKCLDNIPSIHEPITKTDSSRKKEDRTEDRDSRDVPG